MSYYLHTKLPEHAIVFNAQAIFPGKINTLRPEDYAIISQRLGTWFTENTCERTIESLNALYQMGRTIDGVVMRFSPTNRLRTESDAPRLVLYADSHSALNRYAHQVRSEVIVDLHREIVTRRLAERLPNPVIPSQFEFDFKQ